MKILKILKTTSQLFCILRPVVYLMIIIGFSKYRGCQAIVAFSAPTQRHFLKILLRVTRFRVFSTHFLRVENPYGLWLVKAISEGFVCGATIVLGTFDEIFGVCGDLKNIFFICMKCCLRTIWELRSNTRLLTGRQTGCTLACSEVHTRTLTRGYGTVSRVVCLGEPAHGLCPTHVCRFCNTTCLFPQVEKSTRKYF